MAGDNKGGYNKCFGFSPRDTNWRSYSKSLIVELKEKLADRRARTLAVLSEEEDLAAFNELDTESDGLEDTSTNITNNPCHDLQSPLPPEQSMSETSSLTESDYKDMGSGHSVSRQRSRLSNFCVASRHCSESYCTVTSASCDSVSSEESSYRNSGHEETDTDDHIAIDDKNSPVEIDVEQDISDITIQEPSLVGYTDFSEETVVDRGYTVHTANQITREDHGYIKTEVVQTAKMGFFRPNSLTSPYFKAIDPTASKSETSLLETNDLTLDMHSLHTGILMESLHRMSQSRHDHDLKEDWTISISLHRCQQLTGSKDVFDPTLCECRSSLTEDPKAGLLDNEAAPAENGTFANTQHDGGDSGGQREELSKVKDIQNYHDDSGLLVTKERQQGHAEETIVNEGTGGSNVAARDIEVKIEPEKYEIGEDYKRQIEDDYFCEEDSDEDCEDEEEYDDNQECDDDEEELGKLEHNKKMNEVEDKMCNVEVEYAGGNIETVEDREKQALQMENESNEMTAAKPEEGRSNSLQYVKECKYETNDQSVLASQAADSTMLKTILDSVSASPHPDSGESLSNMRSTLDEVFRIFEGNMAFYDDIDKGILGTLESHFSKCGGILPIHENISSNSGYSTNLKLSGGDETSETWSKRGNSPCERSGRLQTCLNKARLASSLQTEIGNMHTYPQTVAARAAYTKSVKDFEVSMLDLLEENKTEGSNDDSANGSKSHKDGSPTIGKQKGDVPRSSNLIRSNTFLVTDRNSQKPPKCVRPEKSGPFKSKAVPTATVFGDHDSDNNDRAEIKHLKSSCDSGRDPHISPTYIVTESENFQADQKSFQQIPTQDISHDFQRAQGATFDVDSARDPDHLNGNNDFDSDSSDSLPDTRVTSAQKYTSTMLEKLLDYDSLEDEKNIHESMQSKKCKSNKFEQDGSCMKLMQKRKTWDETLRCLNHSPKEAWIQFRDVDLDVNGSSGKEDLGQKLKSPAEEKMEMEYNYESDFDTESDIEKNDNDEEENDTKNTKSAGSINESPLGYKTCPAHRLDDDEIIVHTDENSQPVERDESAIINAVFSAQLAALSVPVVGENLTDGRTSPPDFPKQSPTGLESVEDVGSNTNLLTSPLTKRQDSNAASHSKDLTSPEKLLSSSRQSLSKDPVVSSKEDKVTKGIHGKWDTTKKGQKSRPGTFIPKIEWSSSDEDLVDDLHRDISPSDYLKQKQKEDVDGKLHQLHQFAKRKKKSKSPLRLRTPIKADDMDQFATSQGSINHSQDFQPSNENQGRQADNVDSVFKDLESSTPDDQLLDHISSLADQSHVSEVFLSASELLQLRINSDREELTSDIADTRTFPYVGNSNTDHAPAISFPKVVVNIYNPEVQTHRSDIETNAVAQEGTASSSSSTSGEYTLQNSSGKVCSKSESDLKNNTHKVSADDNTDGDSSNQTSNKKKSDGSDKHSCVYDKFRVHSNLNTVEATDFDVANSIEHRVRHVKEEITSVTKTSYPGSFAALNNGQTSTVVDLLQYALNSSPMDSSFNYDPPMLGGKPSSTQDVSISIPSPNLPVRGKNINTPYTADMFQIYNTQGISRIFPSASGTPHMKQSKASKKAHAGFLPGPKESRNVLSPDTPGQSTLNVGLTDSAALHYSGDNYRDAQTIKSMPAKLQGEPSYKNVNPELFIHTEYNNGTFSVCPDVTKMNSHDLYDNTEVIHGAHFQTERPPVDQYDSFLLRQTHAEDEAGGVNHNMLLALSYKVTQLEKMLGLVQNKISDNDTQWRLKYFAGEEIAATTGEDANNMGETQFGLRASTIPTTFSQVSSYGFGPCFCSLCHGHDKASSANCSLIPRLCKCCGEKSWHSGTAGQPSGKLENSLRHSKSTQTENFHPPQNNRVLTIDSCIQCSSETPQSSDFASHFEGLVQLLTDAQHSIQSMKYCSETSRQAIHSLDERLSSLEAEISVKFDNQKAQLREMQVDLTEELRHSRNSLDPQSDLSTTIAGVTAVVDKATAVSQEAVKEQMAGVSCHLIKAVQDMVFPIQEAVSTLKGDVNDLTVSTERVRLAMEESKTTPTTKGMDHETMKMRIVELTSQRDAEKVFHKITRESLRALERDHDRLRQEFVRATCRQARQGERDVRSRVMYFLADKDKEDYGNGGRHRSRRGDRNQSSTCFFTKLPFTHQSQSDDKHKLRPHNRTLKSCTCHKTDVSPSTLCRHRREAASSEPLYGPDSENSKQSAYSGGKKSKTSSKCSEFSHRSATSGSGTPHDTNKEIKHYNLLDCSHKEHSNSAPQEEEDDGVKSQSLQGGYVDDYISHLRTRLLKDDTILIPCSSYPKNYQETANSAIEKSLVEQMETTPICTRKLADIDNHVHQTGLSEELNLCKSCATQDDPDLKQKALISESGTSVGLSDTDF